MMHVQRSLPTLEDYIAGHYNKLQLIWLQYSVYIHKQQPFENRKHNQALYYKHLSKTSS